MRTKRLVYLVGLATCLGMGGCDIASDPVPAFSFISRPFPQQTVYVGEAFRLNANVEAEGPVDSLVVHVQPMRSGVSALRLPLHVPPSLRSGAGNLTAKLEAELMIERLAVESVSEHVVTVVTYLPDGRIGRSQGIPIRIQQRH